MVGSKLEWPMMFPNTLKVRYATSPSAEKGRTALYASAGIR